MLTQEEYMDVLKLRHEGFTITEIADELGYHPATIAKWIAAGGPPPERAERPLRAARRRALGTPHRDTARGEPSTVGDERLCDHRDRGIHRQLSDGLASRPRSFVARAFGGRRRLRCRSSPHRARSASSTGRTAVTSASCSDSASCTASGRSCPGRAGDGGGSLIRSTAITPSKDSPRSMRPSAVCRISPAPTGWARSGSSHGRRFTLAPPVLDFARLHGTAVVVCAPRDAKRKGKIERPFRDLKESFLEELVLEPPSSIAEVNARAEVFLATRVHNRPHSTTGVAPAERLLLEAPMMAVLPRVRFDAAYVEVRRVHPILPLVEWRGVSYSVPPDALGQLVECRSPLGEGILEIRLAGKRIALHRVALSGAGPIWEPEHWAAAEQIALGRHLPPRRHLRVVGDSRATNAYAVEAVDLSRYDLDGDVS